MKLYADTPARRTRQIIGDLCVVAWFAFCIWLAHKVFQVTMLLAEPGHLLEDSGSSLAGKLREVGDTVNKVPVAGDQLTKPFDGAGGAADSIADAGRSQIDAVNTFAWWLAVAVAIVPILMMLLLYLPPRIRFIRRAGIHVALRSSEAGVDLLALRALSTQSLKDLTALSTDPAGAWRNREAAVVQALASLELRGTGMKAGEIEVIAPVG